MFEAFSAADGLLKWCREAASAGTVLLLACRTLTKQPRGVPTGQTIDEASCSSHILDLR